MEEKYRKSHRRSCVIRAVLFSFLFVILFLGVSDIMVHDVNNEEYQMMTGIYREEPNSLDAVYLGSSSAYSFWNPLVAWEGVWYRRLSEQPFLTAVIGGRMAYPGG